MKTETVETRRLLNSFEKGDADNIFYDRWQSDIGCRDQFGIRFFVNDGHFTIDPSKNLDRRWVPGRWKGDRFEYDPAAETGMLLKFQWIDGSGFWDNALAIFERMFEKLRPQASGMAG